MRTIVPALTLVLFLAGCAKTEDPAPALRAEIAELRDEITRVETRLAAAEKQATVADGRIARCEENQRDLAAVLDKVTVRLDRVER